MKSHRRHASALVTDGSQTKNRYRTSAWYTMAHAGWNRPSSHSHILQPLWKQLLMCRFPKIVTGLLLWTTCIEKCHPTSHKTTFILAIIRNNSFRLQRTMAFDTTRFDSYYFLLFVGVSFFSLTSLPLSMAEHLIKQHRIVLGEEVNASQVDKMMSVRRYLEEVMIAIKRFLVLVQVIIQLLLL